MFRSKHKEDKVDKILCVSTFSHPFNFLLMTRATIFIKCVHQREVSVIFNFREYLNTIIRNIKGSIWNYPFLIGLQYDWCLKVSL